MALEEDIKIFLGCFKCLLHHTTHRASQESLLRSQNLFIWFNDDNRYRFHGHLHTGGECIGDFVNYGHLKG